MYVFTPDRSVLLANASVVAGLRKLIRSMRKLKRFRWSDIDHKQVVLDVADI